MGRFIKYLGYTLFLPVWWLQLLFARKSNVWVLGAWYGKRYSDNSMYLFEYINSYSPEIRAVWITKSKIVCYHVNKLGHRCYMANSLQGVYYCLRAKYVIVSSVKKDVNEYWINGAKTIQLWHGNPMKKIGLDDKYSASNGFFVQVIVKHIFSITYEFNYDYVVSNSKIFTKKMASAFGISETKILETGCPRNDIFYSPEPAPVNTQIRDTFKDSKLVYYLPTFRNKGQKQSLLDIENYSEDALQKLLEEENMVFVTKTHFATIPILVGETHNDRIFHLPDDDLVDINFLLKDADILITDYSGAYFDFLLTLKPVIFAAFDLQEYLSASREMYFEYKQIVSGPIAYNWEEVFNTLRNIQSNPNNGYLLEEKNDVFNKYHDNNNSQRVYNSIMDLEK